MKDNNNASSNWQDESDHEMLYTEASIEDAIREMQKYGALKQTGRLNTETIAVSLVEIKIVQSRCHFCSDNNRTIILQLLAKPRCGLPDVTKPNMGKRPKRYVVGSGGWNKRRITYR